MNSEADLTEYYEDHKDDPDIWEEPEEQRPARLRAALGATITVRFSAEEAERIRGAAKASGQTYSQVVRTAVKNFTENALDIRTGTINLYFTYSHPSDGNQPAIELGEGLLPTGSHTARTR